MPKPESVTTPFMDKLERSDKIKAEHHRNVIRHVHLLGLEKAFKENRIDEAYQILDMYAEAVNGK